MKLEVIRFSENRESTLGLLFINGVFVCYTLEDEKRIKKVMGETRIPEGEYKILLRTEGGFHQRYLKRYGKQFHKGMLHVQDVPNFEFILIHTGNTDDHTAGCLLIGDTVNNNSVTDGFLGKSGDAYKRIYPEIRDTILQGEEVTIRYKDAKEKIFRNSIR